MNISNLNRPNVENLGHMTSVSTLNLQQTANKLAENFTPAQNRLQDNNTVSTIGNSEISSIKVGFSEISILENNIELINGELIPLVDDIITKSLPGAPAPELTQMINEYTSKIEQTNSGNKLLLNGNYDIPTNNTIKQVRLIFEEPILDNDKIVEHIGMEKNRQEVFNANVQNNIFKEENGVSKTYLPLEETNKANWQSHNINTKSINHSTFNEDNRNIEKETNQKREFSQNKIESIYSDTQPKIVFRTNNAEDMQMLRQHFSEQRARLENAARQHRVSIDTSVRLYEDMFAAKNTISQIENNKLLQNTFSLSSVYNSLNSETLNKMIIF